MPMDAHDIESMIKAAIPDAEVTIRDLAGDGDHYAATVISASFRGKSRVQQHQIVYQSLQGQMGGVLHALALQTGVPEGYRVLGCGGTGDAMAVDKERGPLFRPIMPNQHGRVTYAELLFDLVFVFAVTQISHTLLGRFHPARRAADDPAASQRVVGVGLHLLDHQLAQPRTHAGAYPAVSADARRARALDLDSEGLRIAGVVVRDRLCRDAGRPDHLLAVIDAAHPEFRRAPMRSGSWCGCRCRRSSGSRAVLPKGSSG
jgi:stress-induced morphogen